MAAALGQTRSLSLGHWIGCIGALGLLGAGLLWAEPERLDLAGARLEGANLNGVRLNGAALKDVQLTSATLQNADLSGADLSHAMLSHADLAFTRLRGADLRGADLRSVAASGADLRGTDLRGAQLEGACLEKAALGDANLFGATYNECTSWPDGFDPQRCGAVCITPDEADDRRFWNGPRSRRDRAGQRVTKQNPGLFRNPSEARAAMRLGPPFLAPRDFSGSTGV